MLSTLQVLKPPAAEPVTPQLAAQHLRVDTPDDGQVIKLYLESARSWVEEFLGRALVTQKLRWTVAQASPPAGTGQLLGVPLVLPLWASWGAFMQRPLELPRSPAQSIDVVRWGTWGQADTTADASTYTTDAAGSPARLRLPSAAYGGNVDHISVDFTAGYDSPAAIPAPIRHAILLLTAFMHEHRGDDGGEMPAAVERLLWPYRIMTFGG